MNNTKTTLFSNGLIWFGAAISIAEILTGTLIAPLGFKKGLSAILIGHFIGCILLYFAGIIGGRTHKSAMETVKLSFGKKGSILFSALNVLQLVGWTALMIINGASAANAVWNFHHTWFWCLIIGILIIFWIMIGMKNLGKLNLIAMFSLFLLTIVLSTTIFRHAAPVSSNSSMSFGAAIELSVAMPLSWLPLISDYTRHAKQSDAASFVSSIVYFFVSSWMYIIGFCATLFTGKSDITSILLGSGLGIAALLIIIFSTVTTTFLDVYSAGVSSISLHSKIKEKPAAIIVCIIGTLIAIFAPITQFENFLYLIGSVFAPMIAILIVDFFLLHKDVSHKDFDVNNYILWIIGFLLYRIFLQIDTPIGNTVPVMIIVSLLTLLTSLIKGVAYAKKHA